MMKKVSVTEAKTQFSRLLWLVERGQVFIITRRGKAIAKLVPVRWKGY